MVDTFASKSSIKKWKMKNINWNIQVPFFIKS